MYSLLVSPQSSCGCFECIVALVPEANGVLIVNREFGGETPLGLSFTQLASSVGGGVQTPGFLGVGKLYVTSRKFISAEGGLPRVVWMPKDLKDALRPRLEARAKELDLAGFVDKIVPTADRAKATVMVKVGFKNYDERVLPEMSSKVLFMQTTEDSNKTAGQTVLVIPETALAIRDGRRVVYQIKNESAVETPVSVGTKFGNYLEIREGLQNGDRVISNPDAQIADGTKVKVK